MNGRLILLAILLSLAPACGTRDRAAVDTMLADLRLLKEVQDDSLAAPTGSQLAGGAATTDNPLQGYAPSPGVTVIVTPGSAGWSAIATHVESPERVCGIFVGGTAPGGGNPARIPGEPRCN